MNAIQPILLNEVMDNKIYIIRDREVMLDRDLANWKRLLSLNCSNPERFSAVIGRIKCDFIIYLCRFIKNICKPERCNLIPFMTGPACAS